jgi:chemotaxis regulatin CheY-phosphate phosphatase CheZ
MTHQEAMRILDKVKDGQPYPDHIINRALQLTGDLDEL